MDKLADRIESAERELVTLKDSLVSATENLEAAPDEESLLVEVEELTKKVDEESRRLAALQKAQAALAARAKPVDKDVDAPAVATGIRTKFRDRDLKPGELMFKMATANLLAHVRKVDPREIIEKEYKDFPVMKEVHNLHMRQKTAIDHSY